MRSGKKQRGFAIGTILLAVILIAAIVSAIVVASRGSGGDAERERARLIAANLLQQTIDLRQTYQQFINEGIPRQRVYLNGVGGSGVFLGVANTRASSADLYGYCTSSNTPDSACIFDAMPPLRLPAIAQRIFAEHGVANAMSRNWQSMAINEFPNPELNNRLTMLYLYNVTDALCTQFNSIARGVSINTPIPRFDGLYDLLLPPDGSVVPDINADWYNLTPAAIDDFPLDGGCAFFMFGQTRINVIFQFIQA